jgi:hypothetical protein
LSAALPLIKSDRLDHPLTLLSLAVLALAMVRCVVPITPNLYWENDPRLAARLNDDAGKPLPGEEAILPAQFLGSSGTALLDALSVAVAGIALLVHVKAGGAPRWRSIIAAFIGMVLCLFHARAGAENAFVCGGWIGAIALAIAALHLASRHRQRRWFLAALAAMTLPLAVEATRYVFIDHRETVDYFMKDEEAALAARGWTRGSPEHLMYLRRMQFNEPTGAFSFSNILASVAACLTLLSTCVAIGLFQGRRQWPWRWMLPAALAVIGAWTVFLTHSKGAPVALMACLVLIGLALTARRHAVASRLFRTMPALAVGLVTLAVVAVILRGMMGPPPTAEGERSVLFRWQYWQAASRIATQSPGCAVLGVGPARFAEDYHWAKNPLNPEEVRSAHNVFVDYIADLGLGGAALSLLLIAWLYAAARSAVTQWHGQAAVHPGGSGLPLADQQAIPRQAGAGPTPDTSDDSPRANRSEPRPVRATPIGALHFDGFDLTFTILFLVAIFGTEMAVRLASYGTPERFLIWSAGMTGTFFTLAVLVSNDWLPPAWSRLALFAAAAVLLVHNQIEMSFFQPASAPLVWVIMGAAGAKSQTFQKATALAERGTRPGISKIEWIPGVAFIIIAIVFALAITAPIARQQSILAEAEAALRGSARSWTTFNATLDLLERAGGIAPGNPKPFEWRSRLAMEVAASMSAQMRDAPPARIHPQARAEVRRLVMLSLKALDDAIMLGLGSPGIHRQRAQMLVYAGDILAEASYRDEAVDAWRFIIDRRPYAWQDRVELADLLWRMDRKDEAKPHYAKAIELSDAMYLEPTREMAAIERRRVERRMGE